MINQIPNLLLIVPKSLPRCIRINPSNIYSRTFCQTSFTSIKSIHGIPARTHDNHLVKPSKKIGKCSMSSIDSPLLLKSSESSITKLVQPITPNDQYVSCTIFDIKGNVQAVSKHFPKMQFLQQHGLFPRDLRKIDTSTIDVIPSIVVRDNCILVNLLHIKALVSKDEVMVFDTSTTAIASKLGLFMYDLELKLKTVSSYGGWTQSYEHRALESILINVMSCLESELNTLLSTCGLILEELEDEIDRNKLRDLLIKSKALTSFHRKASLIRDVLDELLDNDEDLARMYLTEKESKIPRDDYGEVEMLLEAYYKQCDEFVQQAGSSMNDIKSTEEIVNIILDANRNSLMLFELKITVYTLGFTVATVLPAFYGMNLKNYIEDSTFGFGAIIGFSIISAILITIVNFRKLKSVQRLTMMIPGNANKLQRLSPQPTIRHKPKWYHKLFHKKENIYEHTDPKQRDMIWKWLVQDKNK